ncbi:MAG TPA: glycosyltransferase [Chloroflexia bacterium]|nr:glycosyltransferase [Chloroflexia bacterium]
MPGAANKITLLNGWSTRKESLPARHELKIYTALPAQLRPDSASQPSPAAFGDMVAMRVYFVADLLARLIRQTGSQVRFVSDASGADVLVAGEQIPSARNVLLALVARPVTPGSDNPAGFTFAEARYLMYSAPHAASLQWSEGALAGARAALTRLGDYIKRFESAANRPVSFGKAEVSEWQTRFYTQLYDDLNTPRALAIVWTMLQSALPDSAKYALLVEFCGLLGLGESLGLPAVQATSSTPAKPEQTRETLRTENIRGKQPERVQPGSVSNLPAKARGKNGQVAAKAEATQTQERRRINQVRDLRSFLSEPDRFDFTVSLIAYNNLSAIRATVQSILQQATRNQRSVEIVAVEMNGSDGSADYLESLASRYANFRLVFSQQNLGEGAGRNVAFRQGRGRYMLLLDAGLTLKGDLFGALWQRLNDARPGLYGAFPAELLHSDNAPSGYTVDWEPQGSEPQEVAALEGSFLCLPRRLVDEVGFMDEHFRYPYALGLDYSFAFKDKGYPVFLLPEIHKYIEVPKNFTRPDYSLSAEQQERQRQKNWQLFLRSWQL